MTNLEIIKYLATNNPTRLAELLDDIYRDAWNDGANDDYRAMPDFEKWLSEDASNFGMQRSPNELEEWYKAINNPSIEITYPDNLVIEIPYEGKDPNHMWNTDNNFNIITPYMQAMFNGERYDDTVKIHVEGENDQ